MSGAPQPARTPSSAPSPAGDPSTSDHLVTVLTADDILPIDTSERGIGKNEAHMALMSLLGNDDYVTSLDITNEVGFQWTRFLRNQCMNRHMVGPGVCKVLAVRFDTGEPPTLVLCRSDNRYCAITPSTKNLYRTFDDWKTHPMLTTAPVATTPWIEIA